MTWPWLEYTSSLVAFRVRAAAVTATENGVPGTLAILVTFGFVVLVAPMTEEPP